MNYTYAEVGTANLLTSVSYNTSPTTRKKYLYENPDLPFALTGVIDENGKRYATWTYDGVGRGLTSQHAGGADLTSISYNDGDGSRTVTNALGAQTVYRFTKLQGVPKLTEIDRLAIGSLPAASSKISYDANGFVASRTDWNGNTTLYVNDVHGQPLRIAEASGSPVERITSITYAVNFHLPVHLAAPDATVRLTYDDHGELLTRTVVDTTSQTEPYSTRGTKRTWSFSWSNFLLASAEGPRAGQLEKYTYDASGALISRSDALGHVTQITQHLPGGLPQTIVDPNGLTTQLSYDARQRFLSSAVVQNGKSLTTTYTYDPAGNVTGIERPDGSALVNAYDEAHRLVGVTGSLGNRLGYTLDAAGNQTQMLLLDPKGTTRGRHAAGFDAFGRLFKDVKGAGQNTVYTRDANGNPTRIVNPVGKVTRQTFDALNRRTQSIDAEGGKTTLAYNQQDRITQVRAMREFG